MKKNTANGLTSAVAEEDKPKPFNYREWNTGDFVGKYHVARFENKDTPIPGTQVKAEHDYIRQKDESLKRLEEQTELNNTRRAAKLKIKDQSAELHTKVYFETVIGQPIEKAEKVLYERGRLLHEKPVEAENKTELARFFKNVELNRHYYIGYSVTSGYKAIDYQKPENGFTALHIAVRMGHVETVEELLKFKACPDLKNQIGNSPVHEAWMFWKTDKSTRTKEERLDQERRTCSILQIMFSYGAFVDAQNLIGETPLHIACRLGPTQAVKIILGFKANLSTRTLKGLGKLPEEIALEFGNEETFRLLRSWNQIRHHLFHLDFVVVWHKFLQDYEAVITSGKSAEAILVELEMENSVAMLERDRKGGVAIDDPLLNLAYRESNKVVSIPKPWEQGWSDFVKHSNKAGVVDLKTQLENLNKQIAKKKLANRSSASAASAAANPRLQALSKNRMGKYPDRAAPPPKPRLLLSAAGKRVAEENAMINNNAAAAVTGGSRGRRGSTVVEGTDDEEVEVDNSGSSGGGEQEEEGVAVAAAAAAVGGGGIAMTSSALNEDQSVGSSITGDGMSLFSLSAERNDGKSGGKKGSKGEENRGAKGSGGQPSKVDRMKASQVGQRRLRVARALALDGKFLQFTKKMTSDSALNISLRTPFAPMDGTEEEGSTIRMITNQGKEFDKLKKNSKKDRFEELIGLQRVVPVSKLGAYSESVEYLAPTDRDLLYNTLPAAANFAGSGDASVGEGGASAVVGLASAAVGGGGGGGSGVDGSEHMTLIETEKIGKIDLVNDRRPRFVDPELLPPTRHVSVIERMSKEKKASDDRLLKRKQKLDSEQSLNDARAEMEAAIGRNASQDLGAGFLAGGDNDDDDDDDDNNSKGQQQLHGGSFSQSGDAIQSSNRYAAGIRAQSEYARQTALSNLFLKKEEVKYGKGRITTTHNSKGPLEVPWSVVGGRYSTEPGDRTA